MTADIRTTTPRSSWPTLPKSVAKDAMETTARLEAQRAEMNAEAARRNVGNQPVYALIYKDERIIGYIEKSGQWIMDDPSVNVFDIAQTTGFQNPQKMSDWIEKNMNGITVKKFSARDEVPTAIQASYMVDNGRGVGTKNPASSEQKPSWVTRALQGLDRLAQPIYGLVEHEGQVIGLIDAEGGVTALKGVDTERLAREAQPASGKPPSPAELAALRAAWFEAQGATVQRYGTGQKAPTRAQAETMIGENTTTARWQQNLNWFKTDHSA